jgi:hypothetical protein
MKLSIKNNSNISRNTQENALVRALQFLRAVGSDATINHQLKETGFDEAAMKQGWSLVLTAYAATGPTVASIADAPLNDAITKVDAWQSAMFTRAHAALRRFHPEQDAFVFDNLVPGAGIAAVAAVATFLDRLDALESAAERKSSRKVDHGALELLDQRGVTKEQRKEMRALVKWIESTPAQQSPVHVQSPREAALTAVYDWIQDWSECAKTVITRRDQLIRLGIGKRRPRKSDMQPIAPTPIVPVVATPVAPPTDTSSTDPTAIQLARPALLPPKSNGATPGSTGVSVSGGDHA